MNTEPQHWTSDAVTEMASRFYVHRGSFDDVELDEGSVDHTMTDPPYDKRTQDNTRKGHMRRDGISKPMPLGFDALTEAKRDRWAAKIARTTRRWAGIFSDHESSMDWAYRCEKYGMEYVRMGLWVRTGDEELIGEKPSHSGAPQFTGDRPAQGHECIVFLHAKGRGRMRWNGGGRAAIYTDPVVMGDTRVHTTQKPIELMRKILADFCEPGDTIIDPFAGSGTTLAAAKNLGMRSVGIELIEKHATYAARRAAAAVTDSHRAMITERSK